MKSVLGFITIFSVFSLFAKDVSFEAQLVPAVRVNGEQVSYIAVNAFCSRSATVWEELNNGLDHFVKCDEESSTPEIISQGVLYIKAEADGSFKIPAINYSYSSKKILHQAKACVRISPARIVNYETGEQISTYLTQNDVLFCQDGEYPTIKDKDVYSFEDYKEVLSEDLEFIKEN